MNGGPNNMTTSYKYDKYSRNYLVTEVFDGNTFATQYGFDNLGRVGTTTYPSGFVTSNVYDA